MSKDRKRYMRQELARADSLQAIFSADGAVLSNKPQIFAEITGIDCTQMVMCPFCLVLSKLQAFLVSTSKGISQSRAECPSCHNGMLMRNLQKRWTPEAYAEWVFSYARSGFWQKITFQVWKARLADLGWSEEFWNKYRQLKGDDTGENYSDYMNRQGQEAAAEWNHEQSGGS